MPALLVTGASGYLGRCVVARARGWEVHGTYLSQPPAPDVPGTHHRLDLRDEQATSALVAKLRPQAIVHTACANRSPEHVAAIEPAARSVALAAAAIGARLVHVSSDVVFDGSAAPYDESARPKPLSEYGAAKAAAEGIVAGICPEAVIVRTSLICGIDPPDHQTRWLLEAARRGERVTLFTDELRDPIWVVSLADALIELAGLTVSGVLNVTGGTTLDRWTLGRTMYDWLAEEMPANVRPGMIADSGLRRAADLRLDNRQAEALLMTRLRGPANGPPWPH